MGRNTYDAAEVLIYDPVAGNRTATRSALYNLGFRRMETAANLEAFEESMKRRPPDLAVCEAQGVEDELCAMIQEIRLGTAIYNPFIVIIVTTWEQNSSLVTRVLNSGADDLLLRPFSTTVLGQRLQAHIDRRKGFVITSDYVGPDRRRESARPSNVPLFEPPNSLKMKVQERLTSDEATQRLDAELKTARGVLTSEKLRRDTFQICVLWRLMQDGAAGPRGYGVDYTRLKEVTRGVARRCAGTEYEPAIEWCDSILAAIEGLEAGVDRNASMHLLGHAALKLNQVVAPEITAADHLRAIDATVAMVKARMEPAVAS